MGTSSPMIPPPIPKNDPKIFRLRRALNPIFERFSTLENFLFFLNFFVFLCNFFVLFFFVEKNHFDPMLRDRSSIMSDS